MYKNLVVKRAHKIGKSIAVTIDPKLVRSMEIDDTTFFTQESSNGAILMKIWRLAP